MNTHSPPSSQVSIALGRQLVISLKELWRNYRQKLKRCQKRFCEGSVHDLRVETRRLLSKLELLRTLISDDSVETALRILKKRLDVFDELRDTQVQLLCLTKRRRAMPELKAFYKELKRRERRLIKPIARKVRRSRTSKLEKCLARLKKKLRALTADSEANERSARIVKKAVQEACHLVARLRRRIDPEDSRTIHRTRVAFKKVRYMVESLQPVLPGVSPRRLRQMRDYQAMMGDIQDNEMLVARMDELVGKKKLKESHLQRFRQELAVRRTTLVNKYLKSADQLFTFWSASARRPRTRPSGR